MATEQTLINPNYRSNRAKIEQDEKELEELMKKARGESPEKEVEEEPLKEENLKKEKPEEEPKINKEEETFKKRYGDLRRHAQEKEAKLEARIKELEGKAQPAPNTPEEIEAWIKKNPKVAHIIETTAKRQAEELFSKSNLRLEELDKRERDSRTKAAERKILEVHKDFETIRESDAFHDWVEEQPKWIQEALYENEDEPNAVIRLLDLYKNDVGITKKTDTTKQQARDAAKEVSTSTSSAPADNGGEKIWKESDIKNIPDSKFDDLWPTIQEQMANGKFIYDISGGAR